MRALLFAFAISVGVQVFASTLSAPVSPPIATPSTCNANTPCGYVIAPALTHEQLATLRSEYQAYVDREHEHVKSGHEAKIAWGTIALAVATVLLMVFTYKLWKATGVLAKEAKVASDRQFKQTQRALRLGLNSSQRQLRPYINVERVEFVTASVSLDGGPYPNVICIRIKNFGNTPCYSLSVCVVCIAKPEDDEETYSYNLNFGIPIVREVMLCPGQEIGIEVSANISLKPNDKGGLVYGMVVYSDPVSNCERTLRFCRKQFGQQSFLPFGTQNVETGIGVTVSEDDAALWE